MRPVEEARHLHHHLTVHPVDRQPSAGHTSQQLRLNGPGPKRLIHGKEIVIDAFLMQHFQEDLCSTLLAR